MFSGTSLREAAMNTTENSFQYSYLALTFHHLTTKEEEFPLETCLRSQHYVSYEDKSQRKTENCKLMSTRTSGTKLNQDNIKAAEIIFNYDFEYFDTDDENNLVDMGAFIKHFSDVTLRSNSELYTFLSRRFAWGEELPFDNDLKFTTNLKLYSNFVALTSQLFMSCIEGNH